MKSRERQLEELLYQCIVELSYVQQVPAELAASSLGRDLINRGMGMLHVADLSAEQLPNTSVRVERER